MKKLILILICFNCLNKVSASIDSTIFINISNNKYLYSYKHTDVTLAEINESNIRYILIDGSLNYIPKEITRFKFVQEISASNVKGNICGDLLLSFPELKKISISTMDTINLKESDFSVFCPKLQNLSLSSAKGIVNIPDTLVNNNIYYIHMTPLLDSVLFFPSIESKFISLIGPIYYIKRVMAVHSFKNAYFIELFGYSPLDTLDTSFCNQGTLKELSLYISDRKYNFEVLSHIKGVEKIHLINCPCLENLIILNENTSIREVSCSKTTKRKARILRRNVNKIKFKLVVYDN